jgi:hypothetical protein
MAAAAHLEVPPPYRPEPGQPVYEIRAGERIAQVAEGVTLRGRCGSW